MSGSDLWTVLCAWTVPALDLVVTAGLLIRAYLALTQSVVFGREVALDKSYGVSKLPFPCIAKREGHFGPFYRTR